MRKDWKPDICVYHGGCDDGFGAALAVWKRWGGTLQYVPAGYGSPLGVCDFAGRHVLMVDFSLKRQEMAALGDIAASVIVLDHHKTAKAELESWIVTDLAAGIDDKAKIIAHFDMQKSGARMAWEFCHSTAAPMLIAYIEDRDLWRFALPGTKAVSAAIRSYQHDFSLWNGWLESNCSQLLMEGAALLRSHEKNVSSFIKHAYEMEIGGHAVPVVNVPYHYASDTANALLAAYPEAPFAACWFMIDGNRRQFSLRSEDARTDISEIAQRYGGGGHRNAAGFTVAVPDFPLGQRATEKENA